MFSHPRQNLFVMLIMLCLASIAAIAQEAPPFSSIQQDAIRKLVHDYIIENPTIIGEAMDALRTREELIAENNGRKAISERKNEIFSDPDSPVLGIPNGDVTMIEFFDYRCPYCKGMVDTVFAVVQNEDKQQEGPTFSFKSSKKIPGVRLIMKELPLLGPDSNFAARASMASRNQKRYEEFHRALMHIKGQVNERSVLRTAQEIGLNIDLLKKDMDSQRVTETLKKNAALARALNITSTPAIIIGDQIVPGAISEKALRQLIEQARNPGK